jgi:hypothetical protein
MTQTETKGRKPTHRLYCVVGEGKKAQWTQIGAAWPTRNGGFSQSLFAYPVSGRIVMQPIEEQTAENGGEA